MTPYQLTFGPRFVMLLGCLAIITTNYDVVGVGIAALLLLSAEQLYYVTDRLENER